MNFGKAKQEVTVVGLGGEGILRTHGREREAREVILEAVRQGYDQRYEALARFFEEAVLLRETL